MVAMGVLERERHQQAIDFAVSFRREIVRRRRQPLADEALEVERRLGEDRCARAHRGGPRQLREERRKQDRTACAEQCLPLVRVQI